MELILLIDVKGISKDEKSKAESIIEIVEGETSICFNDVHSSKVLVSIGINDDGLNVTFSKLEQLLNAYLPIDSIEDGVINVTFSKLKHLLIAYLY